MSFHLKTSGKGSADSNAIRYRADIDGLRAIAVLSVVFFHVSRSVLPGGYLGVDIFFVISGYLITSIVWRETQLGQFSVLRFYDRRIRRIMPALLLVLFVTTIVSEILLLPTDLMGYGKSLLATVAFIPNIYFWRDTNYFSRDASEKPLLHMWSLGVEEQFYALFPLILLCLARWWPRRAVLAVAFLTTGSLVFNVLALLAGGESPAFFLLPSRAWELGVGAVLGMIPVYIAPSGSMANLAAILGALLVLTSIAHPFQVSPIIPLACPAVIGSALLILAGVRDEPIANRALRIPPLVFFGLISYSLYLWHWPFLVFSQYYLVRNLRASEILIALGSMTTCAVISWRFVEAPFRSQALSIGKVRWFVGSVAALLVVTGTTTLYLRGLPQRLNSEAATINEAVGTNYRCPVSDYIVFGSSRACLMNLPSRNPADADVILLGNSHAQMYEPLWASILAEHRLTGLLVPLNSCLPTVLVNLGHECIVAAQRNLTEVSRLIGVKIVIIGLTWSHGVGALLDNDNRVTDNRDNDSVVRGLDDLIDRLHQAGKQVVLIGPIAEPGWDVASTISRQLAFGHAIDRQTFTQSRDFAKQFQSAISHFSRRGDIAFVRPDLDQCNTDRCDFLINGRSLFSDSSHIAKGELYRFRRIFEAGLVRYSNDIEHH